MTFNIVKHFLIPIDIMIWKKVKLNAQPDYHPHPDHFNSENLLRSNCPESYFSCKVKVTPSFEKQ